MILEYGLTFQTLVLTMVLRFQAQEIIREYMSKFMIKVIKM